jgi:hypothetical protein
MSFCGQAIGASAFCLLALYLDGRAQVPDVRLPPIGVAVEEMDGRWCAEFPGAVARRVTPGATVAVVFPDGAEGLVWTTRIGAALRRQCQTAFPQPRWEGYAAYRLELFSQSASTAVAARKTLGLSVLSSAEWRRTNGGALRADLDGDGSPEEARRCAADEGEHFTLWTRRADGSAERRAHEYFDWGALTEQTCGPGEDGR